MMAGLERILFIFLSLAISHFDAGFHTGQRTRTGSELSDLAGSREGLEFQPCV